MSMTSQLDLALIDPNQTGKATTANEAFEAMANTLAKVLTRTITASPHVLPYAAAEGGDKTGLQFMMLRLTGAPGAGFEVHHPAKQHYFVCKNETGQTATVKTPAGSGVTVAAGASAVLFCDGANVDEFVITASPGGINALTDVDTTTSPPVVGDGLKWNGSNWVPDPQNGTRDLAMYLPGTQTNGAVLARLVVATAITLPSGLTGSRAFAGITATGATALVIRKRVGGTVTNIGTINFAAGADTATFTFSSNVTLAAGDVLEVVAPATADATLADVALTMKGTV